MKLHVLLLVALPMCLAQFSIQGPSDGHRRAQGLKFSEEKGIEYTDASEGGGPGDFTIQGATDGNANFQIQGATDGNSNFQIQGATDGHSNFQIQGPTSGGSATYLQGAADGYSQPVIQESYDANQGNAKSLRYNDPSGYRVNWRSYDRQSRPQAEEAPQYVAQAAAPIHRAAAPQRARRPQPQPQPQPQQQVEPTPVYKSYANAPKQIQQLLQFQQQIPYINVIPEPYRFDEAAAVQAQSQQVREHLRQLAQEAAAAPVPAPVAAPTYNPEPRKKSRGQSRSKRQTHPRQNYQPPVEPQPQYSTNLPNHLRDLLKYQAQIPYNIIANQIVYRPDKPYVPHRVEQPQQQSIPQQSIPQQPTLQQSILQKPILQQEQQPIQQAQYQGQGGAYQSQTGSYTQANIQPAYNPGQQLDYNQRLGYNQQQPGVRPVTEN